MSRQISQFHPGGTAARLAGTDGGDRNGGDPNFLLSDGADYGAGGGVRRLGAPAETRTGGGGQRQEAGTDHIGSLDARSESGGVK